MITTVLRSICTVYRTLHKLESKKNVSIKCNITITVVDHVEFPLSIVIIFILLSITFLFRLNGIHSAHFLFIVLRIKCGNDFPRLRNLTWE